MSPHGILEHPGAPKTIKSHNKWMKKQVLMNILFFQVFRNFGPHWTPFDPMAPSRSHNIPRHHHSQTWRCTFTPQSPWSLRPDWRSNSRNNGTLQFTTRTTTSHHQQNQPPQQQRPTERTNQLATKCATQQLPTACLYQQTDMERTANHKTCREAG